MHYACRLRKAPDSPRRARLLLDRLDGTLDELALANARLLLTELVTNAIEHVPGEEEIEVDVTLEGQLLRVEVRDAGGGFHHRPRDAESAANSGWGIHFVDLLADRWASEAGEGHRVWFEIGARPAA